MTLPRPQRISRIEPPGSLLKRITATTASRRGLAEPRGGGPSYLKQVRLLPCLRCGHDPCGEAAHVKFSSFKFGRQNALGKRLRDEDALPLCRDCHQNAPGAQHKGNEEAFWESLGILPYPLAGQLYAQRGDFVAMHMVIVKVIAERRIR